MEQKNYSFKYIFIVQQKYGKHLKSKNKIIFVILFRMSLSTHQSGLP